MDMDRVRRVAQAIAEEQLQDMEYCVVYEDHQIQDMSEEEWEAIYALASRATVVLPEEE